MSYSWKLNAYVFSGGRKKRRTSIPVEMYSLRHDGGNELLTFDLGEGARGLFFFPKTDLPNLVDAIWASVFGKQETNVTFPSEAMGMVAIACGAMSTPSSPHEKLFCLWLPRRSYQPPLHFEVQDWQKILCVAFSGLSSSERLRRPVVNGIGEGVEAT